MKVQLKISINNYFSKSIGKENNNNCNTNHERRSKQIY